MAPTATSNSYTSIMRDGQSSNNNSSQKLVAQKYLTNCRSLYSCIHCRTHLANHDDLVSRSFQGNRGRAYLFNSVINILCGPAVQRELNTGSHAVADIFCSNCDKTLGWKYEKAFVEAQKYKEGKFIIELEHVVRENRHLELDKGEIFFGRNKRNRSSSSSSSSLFNNRKQGSLTPPSSSSTSPSSSNQWSSSSTTSTTNSSSSNEEVEEDDEELMFPLYDDLCGGRSSYSSNLSSSHHNRMRRSLYLDSTPYDWKYSATSSSIKCPLNLALSLDSAYSSSPQTPPSPTKLSSDQCTDSSNQKSSYHIKSNLNNSNSNDTNDSFRGGNKDSENGFNNSSTCDDNEDETQFEFEADKPEPLITIESSDLHKPLKNAPEQARDRIVSGVSDNAHGSSQSTYATKVTADSNGDENKDVSASNSRKTSLGSIMSLDDDKFYDCLTDHDASRAVMVSSE